MLDLPETKYFSFKNGRLAYRESGTGPTLFLLHGMNGGSQSWAHVFQSLATSFRIVAWDAPGFGESDVFGDSVQDFKLAALALMESLKLNNAVLIGHSMGGVVALQLATDHEASVSGLILSSTHLGFNCPKGAALMPRYANRIERMTSNGVDIAYGRERAKRSTPPETSETVIDFLAKIAAGSRVEGIRNGGRMSQEANNAEICANVKVPVLILSGEKDTVIPSNMHSDLLEALPEAERYVFPNAGHASYAEFPDLFNKRVKDFALNALK